MHCALHRCEGFVVVTGRPGTGKKEEQVSESSVPPARAAVLEQIQRDQEQVPERIAGKPLPVTRAIVAEAPGGEAWTTELRSQPEAQELGRVPGKLEPESPKLKIPERAPEHPVSPAEHAVAATLRPEPFITDAVPESGSQMPDSTLSQGIGPEPSAGFAVAESDERVAKPKSKKGSIVSKFYTFLFLINCFLRGN
jgi:hypothetical protein